MLSFIQNSSFMCNFEIDTFYLSIDSRLLVFQNTYIRSWALRWHQYETHTFAVSNTRLKMYGIGTKIDEIRESATIETSFDISWLNVVIAFKFSEHV